MKGKCPACGVPFHKHICLIGTCQETTALRARVGELEYSLMQMENRAELAEARVEKLERVRETAGVMLRTGVKWELEEALAECEEARN